MTFRGVVRSEWTKLRSLRSTVWSLLAGVLMLVGLGALFCYGVVSRWERMPSIERAAIDPTRTSLGGMFLAQLAIGVLGALIIGAEYSTGMIRSSLAAVPRRLPVLWAKLLVFGVSALVLMSVACVAAFLVGQAILSSRDVQTDLSQAGVLRAVLGAAVYITWVGLLGIALATILRNTAAAIAVLVAAILVFPLLTGLLPSDWKEHIQRWLPSSAGSSLSSATERSSQLTPGIALLMLVIYLAVLLIIGAVLLRRRDV